MRREHLLGEPLILTLRTRNALRYEGWDIVYKPGLQLEKSSGALKQIITPVTFRDLPKEVIDFMFRRQDYYVLLERLRRLGHVCEFRTPTHGLHNIYVFKPKCDEAFDFLVELERNDVYLLGDSTEAEAKKFAGNRIQILAITRNSEFEHNLYSGCHVDILSAEELSANLNTFQDRLTSCFDALTKGN